MKRLIIIAETKRECELLQAALNTEQFDKVQLMDSSYNSMPSVARTVGSCMAENCEKDSKVVVAFNSYSTRRDLCDEKLDMLRYLVRQYLSVGIFCFHPDMSTLLFYDDGFIKGIDNPEYYPSSVMKLTQDSVPIREIQKFLDNTEPTACVNEIFDKA